MYLQKYWLRFYNVTPQRYTAEFRDLIAEAIDGDTEVKGGIIREVFNGQAHVLVNCDDLRFATNLLKLAVTKTAEWEPFNVTLDTVESVTIVSLKGTNWVFIEEL